MLISQYLIERLPERLTELLSHLSKYAKWEWAPYTAPAIFLWPFSVVVYRRLLHPLAGVPGPFLPSVTRLYLWYHQIIQDGTYYKRIEEMHEKYGKCLLPLFSERMSF